MSSSITLHFIHCAQVSQLSPEFAVVAYLASQLPGLGGPCLCLSSRGITGRQPYSLNIYVGSGNQNSGSHPLCGNQGFTCRATSQPKAHF